MRDNLASPVLSHHRAYGSVHGGFKFELPIHLHIEKRNQSENVKESFGKCLFHVAGAGIVPWTETVVRADFRPLRFYASIHELDPPSVSVLPLPPDDTTKSRPEPPVRFFHHPFVFGVLEVIEPPSQFRIQFLDGVGDFTTASASEYFFQAFPEFPVTFRGDPQTGILFQ